MKAIKIFYCYAHEDKDLRDKLVKHLAPLRRGGQISEWSDREILPGVDWELEIETQLNAANIILLLVSSDFMNSNYCYNKEMLRALERQKNGEARVLPIILRPVFLENNFIKELQQLPTDGKPLTTWSNIDEGFKDVITGIFSVVEEMRKVDEDQAQEAVSEQAGKAEEVARAEQVKRISNRQRRDELIRQKARERRVQKNDDTFWYDDIPVSPPRSASTNEASEFDDDLDTPAPLRIVAPRSHGIFDGVSEFDDDLDIPVPRNSHVPPRRSASTNKVSEFDDDNLPAPIHIVAPRSHGISARANVDVIPVIEGHWLNILFPASAFKVKQAVIFSVIESLCIAALSGFELGSWWWFWGCLVLFYMMINISVITNRENVASWIVNIVTVVFVILIYSFSFHYYGNLSFWLQIMLFLVVGVIIYYINFVCIGAFGHSL